MRTTEIKQETWYWFADMLERSEQVIRSWAMWGCFAFIITKVIWTSTILEELLLKAIFIWLGRKNIVTFQNNETYVLCVQIFCYNIGEVWFRFVDDTSVSSLHIFSSECEISILYNFEFVAILLGFKPTIFSFVD